VPIYEFYCQACHTVYSFFSQRVDPDVLPDCPNEAGHSLRRKPSQFATLSASSQGQRDEDDLLPGLDQDRVERAVDQLAGEFENLGEDGEDPRAMARMFRRFGEMGGLEPGPMLEEMLSKLESADDLEQVEAEFGDLDEDDANLEEFFKVRKALHGWRRRKPRVDETLYFL